VKTILYLYYNQPDAITHLELVGYPDYEARIMIIDDASLIPLSCSWAETYRIDNDIPWNQPAANNLGLSKIERDCLLLRMDIDHWIEPQDYELLPTVGQNVLIKFDRIVHNPDGTTYDAPAANNIFLALASTIKDIGGYNEEFCGAYGYDDKELMYRLKMNSCQFWTHPTIKIHVKSDMHTQGLNRDTTRNKAIYERLTGQSY
jgi:hypothetical protein